MSVYYPFGTICYKDCIYPVGPEVHINSDARVVFDTTTRSVRNVTISSSGPLPPFRGVVELHDLRESPGIDQAQYEGLQRLECTILVRPIMSLTWLRIGESLRHGQMSAIAKACINLQYLSIKCDNIDCDIGAFPKLTECYLKEYKLSVLPEWIAQHAGIEKLKLEVYSKVCDIDVRRMPSLRKLSTRLCVWGRPVSVHAADNVIIDSDDHISISGYRDAADRTCRSTGTRVGPYTRRWCLTSDSDVDIPVDNQITHANLFSYPDNFNAQSRLTGLKSLVMRNDDTVVSSAFVAAVHTLTTLRVLCCGDNLCDILNEEYCRALSGQLTQLEGVVLNPVVYPSMCKLQNLIDLELTISSPLPETIYGLLELRILRVTNTEWENPDVFPVVDPATSRFRGFSAAFPHLRILSISGVRIGTHMCEANRDSLERWIIEDYSKKWTIPLGMSRYGCRVEMMRTDIIKMWPFELLPIKLGTGVDVTDYYASARDAIAAWTRPTLVRDYMTVCGADTYLGMPAFPRDIIGLIALYVDNYRIAPRIRG